MTTSYKVRITGVVQGVGMRPYIYNLAKRHGLAGWCLNDSQGVSIEIQGAEAGSFIDALKTSPPALAKIETFELQTVDGPAYTGFTIRESVVIDNAFALISPDIATCADCMAEVFNPSDRRSLYPFTNCTNCGPRYSIIKDGPYDRSRTTMAAFTLCPECAAEYRDPSNRRFHAQPNACAVCGPRVWLADKSGVALDGVGINYNAIEKAQAFLKDGAILAIKGLGGFHLACDAANTQAVERLRNLKRRPVTRRSKGGSNKPFAVMAADVEAVRRFANVSEREQSALEDRRRPIVLLDKLLLKKGGSSPHFEKGGGRGGICLADAVAPHNPWFGVMLPNTPLHHLLFHGTGAGFAALVMTSGNLSEEPIVTSNPAALEKLSHIADAFILHDREIHTRVDDSIVRVDNETMTVSRRSRGFVPNTIDLGEEPVEIYAAGALLKNTFCLTRGRYAILSQHIGDLEGLEAMQFHEHSRACLKAAFKAAPALVAVDMHPDYISTRLGREYAVSYGLKTVEVQHHHAHIVSCMAEHGLSRQVIGVAFDGTGYGADGRVWGGEFMLVTRQEYERIAHLEYIPMPGGDLAVVEPWRMAVAYLQKAFGDRWAEAAAGVCLNRPQTGAIIRMIETQTNSPLTSSAGRLFDAVASLIGVCDVISYEAEAAILLEAAARPSSPATYPFVIRDGAPSVIETSPLIMAVVKDITNGVEASVISWRFHLTLAEVIAAVAERMSETSGLDEVVLSGGVFQNALLLRMTRERLSKAGFKVWTHERVPANDGGISLGQAAIAWEQVKAQPVVSIHDRKT